MRRSIVSVLAAACVCMLGCCSANAALAAPSEHPFEIVPGSFGFTTSSNGAGQHANWVVSFDFVHEGESGPTYDDAREIVVNLPAGFTASDVAVPTCTQAQLLATGTGNVPPCPIASQLGDLSIEITVPGDKGITYPYTVPIYNMEVNSYGITAELGYKTLLFTGLVQVRVRPNDLGLTAYTVNIPPVGEVRNVKFEVWGVPAASEHDFMRGAFCGGQNERPAICRNEFGGPQKAGIPPVPFLSNPTSCGLFHASMEADSWEDPLSWTRANDGQVGPIGECERVPFAPAIEAQPSTRAAESPSGLEVSLVVPQTWKNPETLATANLRDTKVALPEGMTANPGLAEGLGACTPKEYERETAESLPGEGCPAESKIGSIAIETPLLAETIPGAIYMAKPYENPFGSLLALYVVAKDPEKGVLVKVAGKITPCESSGEVVDGVTCGSPGRLITTFDDNPQQPFSKFTLKFRPGASAPLISPPLCGTYALSGELVPWSAPEEPRLLSSKPFQITEGAGGSPCPSGGAPPFKPEVISGTQNNAGGSYSQFYLRLLRHDGEQELVKFSTTMPPGLTGNLTGIPFCPDSTIEAAKNRTGAEEQEHPSCPAASEIGHTLVGAGVGSVLAQNPGKLYLAGPYHGAPMSVVSITSAKVGPFDLGTVVIRFALFINPITAQVEISGAQSDPIPRIIRGIVVHVRDIRAYVDRPNFMINPTNCSPLQIENQITGANPLNTTQQTTTDVQSHFEAADCASLAFKPVFKASTSGKTSKSNGTSLHVTLAMPGAIGRNANIHEVKVELPRQLPSRLSTLQKACTSKQFEANPAGCPAESIVGHAKAITPILPVPLEGPAYFVSYGAVKFPELVLVLQGYGITIDLHGETFISKNGITSSTFKTVPDAPVGSFELTLPAGPHSALTNNGNLCRVTKTVLVKKRVKVHRKGHVRFVERKVKEKIAGKLLMPTTMTGQNGATIHQSTVIGVSGCGKHHKTGKTKHKKRHKKHHRHRG